jgi:sugar phosphate isomerase/epimerase
MNIKEHDIAVCSWSLQPQDTSDLIRQVRQLGLDKVQLALLPLLGLTEDDRGRQIGLLRDAGIRMTAGMMNFADENYASIAIIRETGGYMPEATWPVRRQLTLDAGKLAAAMGISMISVHVGFIPPSSHEKYPVLIARIRELAEACAASGVELLMETGQEHATELLQFLNDLSMRNIRINFDPANMILYGAGDPIEAVQILGRHIHHVHVKDGTLSSQPGVKWGEEVPFGTGQVGPKRFLAALASVGYTGPLAIEREAGSSRLEDIGIAIEALKAAAE